MLRYTPAQTADLVANRRQFNEQQSALNAQFRGGMVGNALTLPRDVWGSWDEEGIAVQRSTLAVFSDLAAATQRAVNIGKVIHYFKTISDSGAVNVSLDGRSAGRTDKPVFDYHGTPVPVIDSEFGFGWREMAAAQSEGVDLDSAARDNAMRKVAETLEAAALKGFSSIVVNGEKSYGLTTHPKRSTRSTGVTLNGATGAEWVAEIQATLELLYAKNFKSPATIYLNWADWRYAGVNELTAGYPKTIAQRILEIPGVREVVPADSVDADSIIALVKDRRVVEVLNGMPPGVRPLFRANPTDDYQFKVMAAAAVQVKFDAEDNCGVAHSS